jgi:thioredoxin reductase
VRDVIVVGGGPAGLSASIQLVRSGFDTLLFEKDRLGGLLNSANLVENYPGFSGGIPGPKLSGKIIDHALEIGVEVVREEVLDISGKGDGFLVRTGENTYGAGSVVLAAGTVPKIPPIPGLNENLHTVDFDMRDFGEVMGGIHTAVIGGGDAAFDYALNISGRRGRCTIVSRTEPRALGLLREKVQASEGIELIKGFEIERIAKTESGFDLIFNRGTPLSADRLLVAVGRDPSDDLLIDPCPEGMFPVGDMVNGIHRQASISAGDGIRCAMMVKDYLEESYDY